MRKSKILMNKYITVLFVVQEDTVCIMPDCNTKYKVEQICNLLHIDKFKKNGISIISVPLIVSFNFKQTYISGKLLNKIYKKHIFLEKAKFTCINGEVFDFR